MKSKTIVIDVSAPYMQTKGIKKFVNILKELNDFFVSKDLQNDEVFNLCINMIASIGIRDGLDPVEFAKLMAAAGSRYMAGFEEAMKQINEHVSKI